MLPQLRARVERGLLWLPFLLLTCGPVGLLLYRAFAPHGAPLSASLSRLLATTDLRILWNSVELGLLVVAATAAVGLPYGFLIARTDLKGRGLFELLVITPLWG